MLDHGPQFGIVSESHEDPFSLKGDSGAGVFDEEGRICGFVLGGTRGEAVGREGHEHLGLVFASYITPFSVIKERVESVTGRTVVIDIMNLQPLKEGGTTIFRSRRSGITTADSAMW